MKHGFENIPKASRPGTGEYARQKIQGEHSFCLPHKSALHSVYLIFLNENDSLKNRDMLSSSRKSPEGSLLSFRTERGIVRNFWNQADTR